MLSTRVNLSNRSEEKGGGMKKSETGDESFVITVKIAAASVGAF